MNALPDYIVLDFCAWLGKRRNHQFIYRDLIEHGEKDFGIYRDDLVNLAKRYIREKYTVQGVFRRFIGSKEFQSICKKEIIDHCDIDEINRGSFNTLLNCDELFDAFIRFYNKEHQRYQINKQNYDYLTPDFLVDSLIRYIALNDYKNHACKYLIVGKEDLSLEIDFLEWLMNTNGKKIDLSKMPLSKFEILASDFCKCNYGSQQDKKKLINSFKHSDVESLGAKLVRRLTQRDATKLKSLRYIFDRYTNDQIPYRCIILPLSSESDEFKNLIDKYYDDLNHLSGDHLDIYYSEGDLDKSGYEIKNNMQSLPDALSEQLPCIVLWEHDIEKAKAIDIDNLSNKKLVKLMAIIVDLIKEKTSFDDIVKEATKMADEFRKENIDASRAITNNTFNVENNTGVIAGNIVNSTLTVNSGSISKETFESESEKAIEIINSFKEVEEEYRNTLIELVKAANTSIQNKDEAGQNMCKSNFKYFMQGAGKVVGVIVTKLSELATIATFFGITASTFIH